MTAQVAIVMGSDSDFPILVEAANVLDDFGVAFVMKVASAHRTPDEALAFAQNAREAGIKVIIAGAGAAAHLAGVLAAKTTLPVIGVPINATPLQGLDALYAMVQMPSGIPVATVAINGAKNAGLLAIQMLALSDASLAQALEAYKAKVAASVNAKNANIQATLASHMANKHRSSSK